MTFKPWPSSLCLLALACLLPLGAGRAADMQVMISAGFFGAYAAQIGFQQVSELIHVPGVSFVGTLPSELQPLIHFTGAVTTNSRQSEAAMALIRCLSLPDTDSRSSEKEPPFALSLYFRSP